MFQNLHSASRRPKASRRSRDPWRNGHRHGFALIVVLAGLAVLTTLFSLTSKTVIRHGLDQRGNVLLAQRQAETIATLDRILALGPETAQALPGFHLQDVAGYIDLNTADKTLIEKILADLNLPGTAMVSFTNWRRNTNRFVRLEDFLRIVGAPATALPRLQQLATVHSFRQGIATDIAPDTVLHIVTGLPTAPTNVMRNRVPAELTTSPTGDHFRVWDTTSTPARPLGVVYLPELAELRRIVWLN